jgi:hypothetical protein
MVNALIDWRTLYRWMDAVDLLDPLVEPATKRALTTLPLLMFDAVHALRVGEVATLANAPAFRPSPRLIEAARQNLESWASFLEDWIAEHGVAVVASRANRAAVALQERLTELTHFPDDEGFWSELGDAVNLDYASVEEAPAPPARRKSGSHARSKATTSPASKRRKR